MQAVYEQAFWLIILAIPIACISWTVTHEGIFQESREYCQAKSQSCKFILYRKFFYLFTCEYCFSHYITIFILVITDYKLLYDDWRGYLIAGFALVWVANLYMSLHLLLRQSIVKEKTEIHVLEKEKDIK